MRYFPGKDRGTARQDEKQITEITSGSTIYALN
jgi:hypothetical protein